MRKIILPLALLAVCTPAMAQGPQREDRRDASAEYANRERCILPQAIAPSFNNNAASMEQMRIAAVTVRRASNRHGDTMSRVCGSEHDPRALDGEMTMGAPEDVPQDDETDMADEREPQDYRDYRD
ncbi:hypothetical protein EKN06_04700 [Croceicoccus ponticola]|uniref:UrcA family protein n=1 Tax=Croceicoccus ponticola TaxID=2217664 RepID=A0A437H1H2_9SPHN|nr:hypothetical protein [Croceicoccus ponticola]RVQ69475.1 hypothetical protein EKN06_04700 [Croceicoccus ponticola]